MFEPRIAHPTQFTWEHPNGVVVKLVWENPEWVIYVRKPKTMPGSVCEYQGRRVEVRFSDHPHGEWQEVETEDGHVLRVHNDDLEPVFDEEFRDIGIFSINVHLKGAFGMHMHADFYRYLALYEEWSIR